MGVRASPSKICEEAEQPLMKIATTTKEIILVILSSIYT